MPAIESLQFNNIAIPKPTQECDAGLGDWTGDLGRGDGARRGFRSRLATIIPLEMRLGGGYSGARTHQTFHR